MKNYSVLALAMLIFSCGFSLHASLGFKRLKPHEDHACEEWTYKSVDFVCPKHNNGKQGMYPDNDPTPSPVGFYDGDILAYKKLLLQHYPDGSCIRKILQYKKDHMEYYSKDYSATERIEHVLQDALMQGKIANLLPDIDTLTAQKNKVL